MKTTLAKPGETEAAWYVVDATDMILGRLATKIARILMGKHKPIYTPHVDVGDFVIVINAEKVRVTGKKRTSKIYEWYTGYHSGRHWYTYDKVMEKHPTWPIEWAVRRMLPKNKLARSMFSKLKVYAGSEHPHQAQMPEQLEL
ncbi:MAG: 50S ribosomal protein L13 [Planctomycetes bacterium]|nr:50S ribosomal protein L13 [Planctomycetota bacterium]